MQMKELAERLRAYYPALDTRIAADEDILKIKLFSHEMISMEPNTLYACSEEARPLIESGQVKCGNILILSQSIKEASVTGPSCNLIILDTGDAFINVFNRIQDLMMEMNRYAKGSTSLLDCIIKGKELRDVIETGFEILGNPIMLMDTAYKVLAYKTNETIDDPVWADLVEHGYSSHKFVSLFKNERIIEKILKSDLPIILDTGVAETIRRFLGKIVLNGNCKGYLAVLEYNHRFSDQDTQITRLICEVISSLMQSRNDRMKNTYGMMFETIIQDLLEKRIEDVSTLSGRLDACEWKISSRLFAVTVDMCKYNDVSFIDFFRNKLSAILPGVKSVNYDEALILLLDLEAEMFSTDCGLFDAFDCFIKENDLLAGISLPFNDLLQLPKFYRQSRRALEIGKYLHPQDRVFQYRDFAIDDFVSESAKCFDVLDYCHESVLLLRDYDDEKNTDYYTTLQAYLVHDKNVIATADALFIHRNTVNYRIEKIEEIIGCSLRDSKETFHMLLTYKLLAADARQKNAEIKISRQR